MMQAIEKTGKINCGSLIENQLRGAGCASIDGARALVDGARAARLEARTPGGECSPSVVSPLAPTPFTISEGLKKCA